MVKLSPSKNYTKEVLEKHSDLEYLEYNWNRISFLMKEPQSQRVSEERRFRVSIQNTYANTGKLIREY